MQGWILEHAHQAHWIAFGALLLAGLNIPISADAIILASALLAATVIPENTTILFLSCALGCYFSAWIAYGVGRWLGAYLPRWPFFSKWLTASRLEKGRHFYQRHGLLTLLIGRFIPFGVRNCIFMTAGMSKMPFTLFILRDLLACGLWSSTLFYLCYTLSCHYELLWHFLKAGNLLIFSVFGMTLIGYIWYKRKKIAHSANL